jgi:hypothetical protein
MERLKHMVDGVTTAIKHAKGKRKGYNRVVKHTW